MKIADAKGKLVKLGVDVKGVHIVKACGTISWRVVVNDENYIKHWCVSHQDDKKLARLKKELGASFVWWYADGMVGSKRPYRKLYNGQPTMEIFF